jgi:uridine kinase
MYFTMVTSLKRLLHKMNEIPLTQKTLIVGIDGGGAAGKSTLAGKLQLLGNHVTVVHMDDFYRPSAERTLIDQAIEIGGNWDWKRVQTQILEPLKMNKPAKYQIYDWDTDTMAEWCTVPVGGMVIIEGCYSIRKELSSFYDIRIWVDSPRSFRLERGVQRDGGGNRDIWENVWLPAEDTYFEVQNPTERADIIIDGTGQAGDISKFEVNVVRAPNGWL